MAAVGENALVELPLGCSEADVAAALQAVEIDVPIPDLTGLMQRLNPKLLQQAPGTAALLGLMRGNTAAFLAKSGQPEFVLSPAGLGVVVLASVLVGVFLGARIGGGRHYH